MRSGAWTSFSFSAAFAEKPVVVIAVSGEGDGPAAIRLQGISSTGFEAIVATPPETGSVVSQMTVTFVAMPPGTAQLPGSGLWLEAGRDATSKLAASTKCRPPGGLQTSWQKVTFQHEFPEKPAFLTTIQTTNNEATLPASDSQPWFTVGVNSVNPTDAWVALEMAETSEHGGSSIQDEEVGWIAVQQGAHSFQAATGQMIQCASVYSTRSVPGWQNGGATVPLGTDIGSNSPLVVASQSKRWGGDGGWVRVLEATSSSVDVAIDEDRNCDTERKHTKEEVSVVAFSDRCII